MSEKPKIAICWLGACGGCDEAVVDLNAALLDVAGMVDIVLWPVALDFKYDSVAALPDKSLALAIISGHVRFSEHREIAHLLRKKAKLVLAYGACACFGGTPGLANMVTKKAIYDWVFHKAPTVVNPKGNVPQEKTLIDGETITLPEMYDHVYTLNQTIDVDYYLPGCPPPENLTLNAINAVIAGVLPPKGSTLAPRRALCDTCPRKKKKPERLEIAEFKRVHEKEADPDNCFLEEGILCLGATTRGGCGESCIRINMPCRGCFGPVEGIEDGGTRFLSALASMLKSVDGPSLQKLAASVPDPAGTIYRFTQPSSILGKRKLD